MLLSRYFGDQIKETEKKHLFGIWFENLKEGGALKDLDIDWRIILNWIHKFDESKYNFSYLIARHVSTYARPSSGSQTVLKIY